MNVRERIQNIARKCLEKWKDPKGEIESKCEFCYDSEINQNNKKEYCLCPRNICMWCIEEQDEELAPTLINKIFMSSVSGFIEDANKTYVALMVKILHQLAETGEFDEEKDL